MLAILERQLGVRLGADPRFDHGTEEILLAGIDGNGPAQAHGPEAPLPPLGDEAERAHHTGDAPAQQR